MPEKVSVKEYGGVLLMENVYIPPGYFLELPFVFIFLKTYSPHELTELMPEEVRIPVVDDSLCSCTVVESFLVKGLVNNNNIFRQKYSGT